MFYMMKTGAEFTYAHYHSIRNIDVFDIPVEDLILINRDFKRYIRILKENISIQPLICLLRTLHAH